MKYKKASGTYDWLNKLMNEMEEKIVFKKMHNDKVLMANVGNESCFYIIKCVLVKFVAHFLFLMTMK